MTDEDKIEAKELAERASRQGRNAAKNATRAVQKGTEAAVDIVADEVRETTEKLEGTAEDALQTAKRLDMRTLTRLSSDTGQAFMALSVALWSGTIAVNKFRVAYAGRKALLK